MLIKLLGLFCCSLFLDYTPVNLQVEEISGKVISVKDGDTIEILFRQQPIKVRLYGIDCPEKKQDFGSRAHQFTSSQCFGQFVTIQTHGKDRYRRMLGVVILSNGANLNHLLVKHGFAWRYKYSKDKVLGQLEQEARVKKAGLWNTKNPIPPWMFRAQRKLKSTN